MVPSRFFTLKTLQSNFELACPKQIFAELISIFASNNINEVNGSDYKHSNKSDGLSCIMVTF